MTKLARNANSEEEKYGKLGSETYIGGQELQEFHHISFSFYNDNKITRQSLDSLYALHIEGKISLLKQLTSCEFQRKILQFTV